jgi:hypothetical protein
VPAGSLARVSEHDDGVRVSDDERDAAAAALGAHWEAGRLALPELEQRGRLFLPGLVAFREHVELRAGRARLRRGACQHRPGARYGGLSPDRQRAPHHAAIRLPQRPAHPDRAPITVLFLPGRAGGTRIVAFGEAPRAVRKAFAELRE